MIFGNPENYVGTGFKNCKHFHVRLGDIYPVAFRLPLEQILRQNENRRGNVRTYVPRSVIRRMYYQWQPPTENEKYAYKHILLVGDAKGDEIE